MASDVRGEGVRLSEGEAPAVGQWVRVRKRVRFQESIHPVTVEGRLVEKRRQRTESSFAGGPQGRYWVDELVIEKAGGERSMVVVDQWTRVERLEPPAEPSGGAAHG
jgi:hypothetical protein